MNEMDQLTRLRAEVPARVSAEAEGRFYRTFRSERFRQSAQHSHRSFLRRSLPRPSVFQMALSAGLAAAVAVAIVFAVPRSPAGHPSASGPGTSTAAALTTQELAFRASAAALAGTPVSPGQWFYIKEATRITWQGRTVSAAHALWRTANGLQAAHRVRGQVKVTTPRVPAHNISYADLGSLPASPKDLVTYLYNREVTIVGHKQANLLWQQTFGTIVVLLREYVLPSSLAAELYQALPAIPGVKVVHVTKGVAFTRTYNRSYTHEIILNPSTYALTGVVIADPLLKVREAVAFTSRTPVSGPGVRP